MNVATRKTTIVTIVHEQHGVIQTSILILPAKRAIFSTEIDRKERNDGKSKNISILHLLIVILY